MESGAHRANNASIDCSSVARFRTVTPVAASMTGSSIAPIVNRRNERSRRKNAADARDHVEPQIRLDMIELRTVAQESDTPTFALQRL